MRGYMKELKNRSKVAFAGASSEGVGVVHLHKRIPVRKTISAARGLNLVLSDESHPERRKYLEYRTQKGALVATLVDFSLLLLPKNEKIKKTSIELANALLQ